MSRMIDLGRVVGATGPQGPQGPQGPEPTDVVHLSGDETIEGNKTFNGALVSAGSVKGSEFAAASMQSRRWIDLVFPNSGNNVVLPDGSETFGKSGYLIVDKYANGINQFMTIIVKINDATVYTIRNMSNSENDRVAVSAPVPKGATVQINYSLGGNPIMLRHIYANAEE